MKLGEIMDHIKLLPHKIVYYDKDDNRNVITSPNWKTLCDFIEENKETPVTDWAISMNFDAQTILILCF